MGETVELKDVIRPGTKRGLDFVIVDELRKRTGINPDSVLKFALAEMLCNALDTNATKINIRVEREPPHFCRLEVADNGSKKLSLKETEMILDFESKASSKRGFLMVSRGYLGNALKCIFGYSYALAELRGVVPPDIIVESGDFEYRIALKPDRINEVIKSEVETTSREDDGFTTFIVKFPIEPNVKELEDVIFATSLVNPTREIAYDMGEYGGKGTLGSEEEAKPIRKETSVLWYTSKQFLSLYKDFLKVRPTTQLKEFISLFRGFTSKKIIKEILGKVNTGEKLQKLGSVNRDSEASFLQFFPATPIRQLSDQNVLELLAVMKARAKPIARNKRSIRLVLGCVGKESLERVRERRGWKRLRYVMMKGVRMECREWYHGDNPCRSLDHVEFPYLVELAVFDRENDGGGLKVYQCVNFMASMEDIFAKIFDIHYRLGRVGITQNTPITVLAHLICPVLKWLNYGKSGLDE